MIRIGTGYDVHAFGPNRKLILGGIDIPYEKGLVGHSDADVLTHTIMDAMLGCLSLGSIGDHFPDTDPQYKNADSLVLLEHVHDLIKKKGYTIGNIDSVVIAQEPKLKPYILFIRQKLAATLSISVDDVSVKATTTEWLGFEGKKLGMACQAVVLITKS
ncbi:2-C-methyl-D-erythritol 2,4-cyclodiphosphate synthase [bacterium]|mgnify:CR=1 FL=1|jgi:2-C-methyl-D-erythritol 2,4-cyclodiphosphate synthase|nr:2-C-methyl-D-erythritol 2,4-cyclodiphosphate synthase [bacterium]